MYGRSTGVRVSWVSAAVRELQVLAGELADVDRSAALTAVGAARSRIPAAKTPLERCLLEHFIHKATLATLPPSARTVVELFTSEPPAPRNPACASIVDAGRLLETRFIEPWTEERLARQVGYPRRLLARQFRSQYGVSIHAFLTAQRLRAAALLLTDEHAKIEAVSLLVGYKSKKNFYAEFRRSTGLTPAQFRSRGRG